MKIIEEFLNLKSEENESRFKIFFKTNKGEYAYHDRFLGISVPKVREFVKKYYSEIKIENIENYLHNKYHEIRLFGLLLMVKIYEKQKEKRNEIFKLYIKNTKFINNWDLVDLSAPHIVGRHCFENKNIEPIKTLSHSNNLWEERISIVSQIYFIKRGEFGGIFELCEKKLTHKHDLIHKALGWMLREVGKKDESALLKFLDKFYLKLPRTTLRYSIERLSPELKKHYMKKN